MKLTDVGFWTSRVKDAMYQENSPKLWKMNTGDLSSIHFPHSLSLSLSLLGYSLTAEHDFYKICGHKAILRGQIRANGIRQKFVVGKRDWWPDFNKVYSHGATVCGHFEIVGGWSLCIKALMMITSSINDDHLEEFHN